jgi:hypothetical protein
MTNEDLKLFVNRYVMMQFRSQQWLVPHEEGGKPMPTGVQRRTSQDQPPEMVPLTVPFLVGKLVERNGSLLVQFMEFKPDSPTKIEVIINPDMIFSVSALSEERLITAP